MSFLSSRILLVEDDVVDAERVRRCLLGASFEVARGLHQVSSLKDAMDALEAESFDLVLLDLTLPDSDGLTTATRVLEAAPRSAVVVLTGQSDQKTALEAMTLGASDFLVKGEFDDRLLMRALSYGLERQRILFRLQKSEEDYRLLAEHSGDLITRHACDLTIKFASEASRVVVGIEPKDLVGTSLESLVHEPDRPSVAQHLESLPVVGTTRFEFRARCALGKLAWMETIARQVNDDSGELVLVTRNVQDRKAAEERLKEREAQLMRARQLESLGRLAGGVAHDFNNLLTIISGYTGLMLEDMEKTNSFRADIQEISDASQRGARLVGQLLTVARRQVSLPRALELTTVLKQTARLLRAAVGEHIELKVTVSPDAPLVWMDPTQLEQMLLNLAFNARDAMPEGGVIELGGGKSDRGNALLTVSDTGCGMEQEVLDKLFEPFFTTKGELGTGLGLATVYGLAKQSGGDIKVESRVGEGTVFQIELPVPNGQDNELEADFERPSAPIRATVLLVEDDESVRRVAATSLQRAGFTVLAARGGPEALEFSAENDFDLLLTDVVMPQMSGIRVVEKLRAEQPLLKVLLMSGYNQDPEVLSALESGELAFLPKPFTPSQLVKSVCEALAL